MGTTWEPSSSPKGLPRETPLTTEPGETGLPWDRAPATSHLYGFVFYDARKYGFLRKFGTDRERGKSRLKVRFLDKPGGRLSSEYWYYFSRHDVAEKLYQQMKAAASPGTLIPDLEAGCDFFQKQGQFSEG